MKFYALQKTTLLDYPGKIASLLFTGGCNMYCPYCHNPDLVNLTEAGSIDEDEVLSHLQKRRGILEGVCITGGEPLIHGDRLLSFIDKVKALGFLVKLDTNGTFSELLKKANVDYIAMDIKTSMDKYDLFFNTMNQANIDRFKGEVLKSIEYIKSCGIEYEFRTTVTPKLVTVDDIHTIATSLIPNTNNYALAQFRPMLTLDPTLEQTVPYPIETLEQMKSICTKNGINCKVRADYNT